MPKKGFRGWTPKNKEKRDALKLQVSICCKEFRGSCIVFLPWCLPFLDLPFLGLLAKKPRKTKTPRNFCTLRTSPNPGKKKQPKLAPKRSKRQGISLVRKDQGNPKRQGMEDQGWGQNHLTPFFMFWGLVFGDYHRKLCSIEFLGELVNVM